MPKNGQPLPKRQLMIGSLDQSSHGQRINNSRLTYQLVPKSELDFRRINLEEILRIAAKILRLLRPSNRKLLHVWPLKPLENRPRYAG
jgi:hypothetical protein